MKSKSRFEVTMDDQALIFELWKWKFLTTAMIKAVAYPGRNMQCCYKRLVKLEKQKYIESRCSANRVSNIWQLTDKGYQLIPFDRNHLEQGGFKSENPDHDFWVNAIHLGWMLAKKAKSSYLVTEQQLRKMNYSGLEEWVPQSKQHRPDGWIKADLSQPNENSLVALEVELSKQSSLRYNDIGNYYSSVVIVNQVLWFVKTLTDANYYYRHLKNGYENRWNGHSFVLIGDYIKFGFQAQIILGKDQGQKVSKALQIPASNDGGNLHHHCVLDTRKIPMKSSRVPAESEINLELIRCS